MPKVIAALPPHWRPLYATAIYTGMRQGELLGLRKSDVDLEGGTITVARSYDHETTKGGHADVLPIAEDLRPFLEEALDQAPGRLVFPRRDGEMHHHEVTLDKHLRWAMGRAGVVTGYLHKCRRCGFQVELAKAEANRCTRPHPNRPGEVCDKWMWSKPIPRHVRFHDLRHTTATLLLKNGAPLATVQRILRHTDPRLTSEIYGHLDVDDMRKVLNALRFEGRLADSRASTYGMKVVEKTALPPEAKLRATLLTIAQVANALGIPKAAAYQLIESNALPHIRTGNVVRVSEEVLNDLLRKGSMPVPPRAARTDDSTSETGAEPEFHH